MPKIIKVYLELTFLCNLKCKFCYVWDMQSLENRSFHQLDTNDQQKLVSYLHQIFFEQENDFVYDVDILWWEPTLSENLLFTVTYIYTHFKVRRFTLTSNGTTLVPESINKLSLAWIKEFRISLHWTEKIHNNLVWKNVFSRVIQSIQYLKERNISYTLIYVVNRSNYKDIIPLIQYLHSYSLLPWWIFFEFVEFSWYALGNEEDLALIYTKDIAISFNSSLNFLVNNFPQIWLVVTNFPKCILHIQYHTFIDDNYSQERRYELYKKWLARKSLFWFSFREQRSIIANHFRQGFSINFQNKIDSQFIPDECSVCKYRNNCYLLVKETILYDYLQKPFLRRKSYFEINKKQVPWI